MKKDIRITASIIMMVIAIALVVIRLFIIVPVTVAGNSMYPTYKDCQIIFGDNVNENTDLEIGDVVVFKSTETKGEKYIKRIEAVPGDTVQIKDGILYRNGNRIDEGFEDMEDAGLFDKETKLGENEYFVLGDNRNKSIDSRDIGLVHRSSILYKIKK